MNIHQAWVPPRWSYWLFSPLAFGAVLALATSVNHPEQALGDTSIIQTTCTGDLGTTVGQHANIYGIEGGKPVGNNLFHSFAEFSIATGDIAQFQTVNHLQNANVNTILARVTGGNASSIFGTIDSVTFYPGASLFLMNPAGIIFGPDATLNIGGMTHFTTADYLRLSEINGSNSGIFYASTQASNVLTSAPVAAFGFLGPNPAAISVEASTLAVKPRQSISLTGGNQGFTYINPDSGVTASVPGGITITGGNLSAEGGQINIVSVASSGKVLLADSTSTSGMTMGNIDISQGAKLDVSGLDVSGNGGGTVRIRGGQLIIAEGTISADTNNADGASTAIDIRVVGDLVTSNSISPTITARTNGPGNSGDVLISSGNLSATSNSADILSFIDTHTSGAGKAGNVNIVTGNLRVTGNSEGLISFIYSGTEGPGHGGDVTITARDIKLENHPGGITTGNFIANLMDIDATGSAGNVALLADRVRISSSQITTDAFSFANGTGQSGNIAISAPIINLDHSPLTSAGHKQGGAITINTNRLDATASKIISQTNLMDGGSINITGDRIELSTGSSIVSSTGGDGDAGAISITATDHLGLLRATALDTPSGIFSNSFGKFGKVGDAGNVTIRTAQLDMIGGARINTSSATTGHGGDVTITADVVKMSGESGAFAPEPLFSLGVIQPSGVFTRSVGGNCSGLCGDAGKISITTGSLLMGTGSQVNSGTSSSGQGGTITIAATDTIAMAGTISTGQSGGIQSRSTGTSHAGAGGNIFLTAGQSVTIQDGATVSASSTGPGHAGKIDIDAGQQLLVQDSKITTEALQAKKGGDIKLVAIDRIHLANGEISTSVRGGHGSGGNITIDPKIVVLQNSQILAQAVRGKGGDITITTQLFMPDSVSRIDASTPFGLNGAVRIQAPYAPAGGKIQPLGNRPLQATSLLHQRCAAVVDGQFSSFTVAGRNNLPTEPGGWLSSPLALSISVSHGATPHGDTMTGRGLQASHEPTEEFPSLSLRQIAPPRFLTNAFAIDRLAGCRS